MSGSDDAQLAILSVELPPGVEPGPGLKWSGERGMMIEVAPFLLQSLELPRIIDDRHVEGAIQASLHLTYLLYLWSFCGSSRAMPVA